MATYADALAALRDFRADLNEKIHAERDRLARRLGEGRLADHLGGFVARGAFAAFSTPLMNIHATGVGIRTRKGRVTTENVIKVYVFDKQRLKKGIPGLEKVFDKVKTLKKVNIDIEHLPVQLALGDSGGINPRAGVRPLMGGISVAPLNELFVGTLGCLLRRSTGGDQILALSNNHVFAGVNRISPGTVIVQPGPEGGSTTMANAIGVLSDSVPIEFPSGPFSPVSNRLDAAVALISDPALVVQPVQMLGVGNYKPSVRTAIPGMKVVKSGRTTGVTTGTVIATHCDPVQVNYGTQSLPRITVFSDTIEILGDDGQPFSLQGDSGSIVIEQGSGHPLGLLFAGDGKTSTACDLEAVCERFQALPI